MNFGAWWCVAALVASCRAESWQWPEQAASVRIDTKVRFLDHDERNNERGAGAAVQADEPVFQEAAHTDGFYNRPAGAGRVPVRVESAAAVVPRDNHAPYSRHLHLDKNFQSDGTMDSLQYCKCVSSPDCSPRHDSAHACGAGKFLCCYKGPYKAPPQNTEYFNEIEDERASLLPGDEDRARPFPPAPGPHRERGLLVGPAGPSGHVGPPGGAPAVLVGPGGPTGLLGPHPHDNVRHPTRNPDLLVGPEGPTNVIGPAALSHGPRDVGPSESAQRGVLVGPGGPTGVIGPRGFGQQRAVLVGTGGPTGVIGPRMQLFNEYFGHIRRPGLLIGPGGPTGIVGPGRHLLTGPGGPTGHVGPQNYFG